MFYFIDLFLCILEIYPTQHHFWSSKFIYRFPLISYRWQVIWERGQTCHENGGYNMTTLHKHATNCQSTHLWQSSNLNFIMQAKLNILNIYHNGCCIEFHSHSFPGSSWSTCWISLWLNLDRAVCKKARMKNPLVSREILHPGTPIRNYSCTCHDLSH